MTFAHSRLSVGTKHRRIIGVVVAAGLMAAAFSGTAGAREITPGAPVVTPTCNPVSSLSYKGDATTADTALATIDVTYSVKPCDKNPVIVDVSMYETTDPSAVVYSDPNALLSGKFRVAGVKVRFSYQVTVSVYDATTGALSGSKTIFAAANPKRV